MHLLRIQVPNFRVLKNVDITFEKDFVPRIFPLGSLNGGGKSTLLQLIFTLLHCSGHPERMDAVRNILDGFKVRDENEPRTLAIIHIWDGEKEVELKFFACKDSSLQYFLSEDEQGEIKDLDDLRFSNIIKFNKYREEMIKITEELKEMKDKLYILDLDGIPFGEEKIDKVDREEKLLNSQIKSKEEIFIILSDEQEKIEINKKLIDRILQNKKIKFFCDYSANNENEIEKIETLLCEIKNLVIEKADEFFNKLSQKVFLAAPSTQVFLFLSNQNRKILFKKQDKDNVNNYWFKLEIVKNRLPGFFPYDFLPVNFIIEVFKSARDKDFKEAIETGEYGQNYKKLLKDLNFLLADKKINVNTDLSEITFKNITNDEEIELYPEDLSHGELKMLSIYIWIKYGNIENAIVLMDEIEIAFHPDWQYQIIAALEKWGSSNQYILATHSYELCQALTPSHVKELAPKLLKPKDE